MTRPVDKATRAIIEEANRWLVKVQESDGDLRQSKAFLDWLQVSPVHVREYLRAEQNWETLSGIDLGQALSIEADSSESVSNVVPFNVFGNEPPGTESRITKSQWQYWLSAAAIATLAITLLFIYGMEGDRHFETVIGEQKRVVLNDGSIVELNTDSEIAVAFTDDRRDISLIRGEALFTVSKDATRPFRVSSEEAVVSALGTQFNVYRRSGTVVVTVLEGEVGVEKSRRGPMENDELGKVRLTVGDQAKVTPDLPIVQSQTNEWEAVAWRDLRLIFRDQPLSEVVAEFNRYNQLKLTVPDGDLARRRISGVFDANRPDGLLKFLGSMPDIDIRYPQKQQAVIRITDRNE